VVVNMEGDVGTVSMYTEMGGFGTTGAELGFNVTATKRSSGLVNFGMRVDSTKIFPCSERTMRICELMSLGIKLGDIIPRHLVGFTEILVF